MIKKLQKVFYLLTFVCISSVLISQGTTKDNHYYPKPAHPNWFKMIPLVDDNTPEWAKVMYNEDTNFEKVERLKYQYYKENSFEKNIHIQNYKHWFKIVNQHVKDDGYVSLPESSEVFLKAEKVKQNRKPLHKSNPNTWTNIGPDITYKNDGSLDTRPTQANVYCLGVAPSNPNVVYAGMETGGIFKSIDKGLNWVPVSHDYAIGNSQDIKVDPIDEDIVYVARDKDLYKSINGGSTWTLQYASSARIEQLYIHTTNTDTIYAATQSDVLKSEDGGATWVSKFSGYVYDIEAKPGTNDTFYISIKDDIDKRPEIYKSTDSGDTWTLMDNGYYMPSDLSVATVYGCKIGVTPADPNRIYAGIIATGKAGDNGWISIYYSLDEGATWQEDSGFDGGPYVPGSDPATNWYVAGYSSGYHQGWYNFDIDVSHSNPDKLWIGTIWFCESGNKGGNIEYIRSTRSLEMHADIQDIDVVGSDIWIASDGGINYSNDECATTEVRMNGITASDFWGFGHGWNEDVWVGGRYHNGDIAYHENYGVGNTMFLGGAESPTGYVNPYDNRKTYFTDISDKYIPFNLSTPSSNIPNLGLYPTQSYFHFSYSEMEYHPNFANIIYTGNDSILYKSVNSGGSFDTLYQFPGLVRRFEISRDNPNYIYAIVYHSYWTWHIHKSTDGGQTFVQLPQPNYTSGSWRNLSFTLNPFDKNEIWLASNSSDNGNKVFSSDDGGLSWTNRYSPIIADEAIKDMIFHSGVNGDKIYTMTNESFFFFDKISNDWVPYATGLPVQHTGFMILPFHRDNKIRMASSKGIWEVPFEDDHYPQATPMIDRVISRCPVDTMQLESHSIVNQVGVTWDWTITPSPLYIDNINVRDPKVVFGSPGIYDIELMVTDANSNTSVQTLNNAITITNECGVDSIPGKVLEMPGNSGDYAVIPAMNLNSNTLTTSVWVKPNGIQNDWAGILFCRGGSTTMGFNFASNNELRYHWNGGEWPWSSGAYVDEGVWSHIALVVQPDSAKIYINGIEYGRSRTHAIEAFDNAFRIGNDPNSGSRTFEGQMDELCIWNRALSKNEIRALRHLTKEDHISTDPLFVGYYQFNETDGTAYDKTGNMFHADLNGNVSRSLSDAPLGTGESEIIEITGAATVNSITDVDITFGNAGTYPNGDIVITKIELQPDTLNGVTIPSQSYWILNNYGSNASFTALTSLSFNNLSIVDGNDTHLKFQILSRSENGTGPNWAVIDQADAINNGTQTITFNNGLNVQNAQQFVVDKTTDGINWIGVISTDWNNPGNWQGNVVPDLNSDVIIPPSTPFSPIVNVNSAIKTLTVLEGAVLVVPDGITFDVAN